MTGADLWELFAETGEPLCYLACRALDGLETAGNGEETADS
ncbi:MAG: hypothetical protein ACLUGW_02315 [Oscillospiraceae bacterium]